MCARQKENRAGAETELEAREKRTDALLRDVASRDRSMRAAQKEIAGYKDEVKTLKEKLKSMEASAARVAALPASAKPKARPKAKKPEPPPRPASPDSPRRARAMLQELQGGVASLKARFAQHERAAEEELGVIARLARDLQTSPRDLPTGGSLAAISARLQNLSREPSADEEASHDLRTTSESNELG